MSIAVAVFGMPWDHVPCCPPPLCSLALPAILWLWYWRRQCEICKIHSLPMKWLLKRERGSERDRVLHNAPGTSVSAMKRHLSDTMCMRGHKAGTISDGDLGWVNWNKSELDMSQTWWMIRTGERKRWMVHNLWVLGVNNEWPLKESWSCTKTSKQQHIDHCGVIRQLKATLWHKVNPLSWRRLGARSLLFPLKYKKGLQPKREVDRCSGDISFLKPWLKGKVLSKLWEETSDLPPRYRMNPPTRLDYCIIILQWHVLQNPQSSTHWNLYAVIQNFPHSWLPCLMFNLKFSAGWCYWTAVGQNGRPCLVTGQWARPRAVKHQEILTVLDCSGAQAALLFSLRQVSADFTFDLKELVCTREVKRHLDQGEGRQTKAPANPYGPCEPRW